jgi:hypothetical protein
MARAFDLWRAARGPSIEPFAKSANGLAQDDNSGREARREPVTTKNDGNDNGGGWDAVWVEKRISPLRCSR